MKNMLAVAFLLVLTASGPARALDDAKLHEILVELDNRQKSVTDFKALAFIHTKERNKEDVAMEAVIYRRDSGDQFMILLLKPKSERGKGYLQLDRNLWMYDPSVGNWDRRTERERIAGSDSRHADFDDSRLAEDYTAADKGPGKLGKFKTRIIRLKAKEDADVPYPEVEIQVDAKTGNILKQQDIAASGKLMRTVYFPKWKKIFSKEKNDHVWYPGEIHIFDEVEKDNSTRIIMREVDLSTLPANIFTKAWLESQSR